MVRRAARRRVMRRLQRGGRAQRGVLLVRLERGVELCRAHGPARPADCYVTVQLAGEHRREVRKTRVVSASRNPVWNADFALFVDDAARAELLLSAFDFSGLEAHIPMGAVRLPLLDVVAEQGGGPGVRASYRLEGGALGALAPVAGVARVLTNTRGRCSRLSASPGPCPCRCWACRRPCPCCPARSCAPPAPARRAAAHAPPSCGPHAPQPW